MDLPGLIPERGRLPLRRIADAHRHVEAGRKKGDIVVTTKDLREPAP
jgi:hypothetical protein